MCLSFPACAAEPELPQDGKPVIVTTLFPAYDFARQIAGERATVILLVPPGAEAHSFEPTAKDMIRIQESTLFFCNGGESEAWVEELLEALSRRERPCVVVLWGDHAPGIGDFGLEFGRGSESAPYYRTPLLLWNNYGADLGVGEEAVAAYRLGALVLKKLGFRTDAYFNWLAELTPDLVESQRMIEEEGRIFADEARYDALDRELLLLHYDRLKGEGYWKGAVK